MRPLDCNLAYAGAMLLAASLAGPALAQEAPQQPQQEARVIYQTSDGEELVCKMIAPTGTRIEEEYCLTEDDWEEIRRESRRILEQLARTGTGV